MQYITQWGRGSSTTIVTKLEQMTEDSEFDSRKQQILIYSSPRLDSLGIHPGSSQVMLWDFTQHMTQQMLSVIRHCDKSQLLHVSVTRCHNQGVITTEV